MTFPRRQVSRHVTPPAPCPAFTLVEMLIVIAVVALLLSILAPSLSAAREQARAAVCGSNLRQIAFAVMLYADENNNHACPGAADARGNLHRWHGSRDLPTGPFDATRGPLVRYLGDGRVRSCPSFRHAITDASRAFELGNGGYGYNNAFIGRMLRPAGGSFYTLETDRSGVQLDRVHNPTETVMFTDAAFVNAGLIEYSFAEPRFFPTSGYRTTPSIHFRHNSRCNVAWCDGHVDRRQRTFTAKSPFYLGDPDHFDIGWFGKNDDNGFFDLD